MADLVTIEKSGGIADVRLNRPDKYNALNPDMFKAIIEAGESLAEARDVRAVVLSGNGRGFCAGLDMGSFQGMAGNDREVAPTLLARDERPENHAQRPAYVWKKLPVPVIAAIHGVAYGGGCQIALGADIRIAAPDAKLSVMEIKWGLIPDMSITQTLRDIVPLDVAKELTFTGRVLSGEEAFNLGLVTHVAGDPLAAAMTLAEEIAAKSPEAVRAGKRLFEESWHADARTGLEMEAGMQSKLIGSRNQIEAIKANFEKRPPEFED
ncbi:MAG: crotonase/enoyl-CoA hydratase family protein [Gammaproteobacteria bacterium]|nr:crotonase/enoyl-CoA hydratase family protein [Gammaproteobacteria bacterium]MCZ6853464.1 crotonase/enoyl-CoA hydratase family protein [Gammaproteobacteria bacterium]